MWVWCEGLQFTDQHCLEWALDIASGLMHLQLLEMGKPKFCLRSHHIMVKMSSKLSDEISFVIVVNK